LRLLTKAGAEVQVVMSRHAQEFVGPLQGNCYLLACPQTRAALVIDPGDEGARILAALRANDWQVAKIVNTHGHFDHIGANRALVAATGAPLLLHAADLPLLERAPSHARNYGLETEGSPAPDQFLEDGDEIACGTLRCRVTHLPGHSPGGIAIYCGGHLFVGDVLFADSVGRADLPGGDHRQLIEGIRNKLWPLPGETVVHPGHGPDTTIARERRSNPYAGVGVPV
jgi:glyoxylase-like metal-dependent hydrolase (beta-lactamase superfamily II)